MTELFGTRGLSTRFTDLSLPTRALWLDAVDQGKVIPLFIRRRSSGRSAWHADLLTAFKAGHIRQMYMSFPKTEEEKPEGSISRLRAIFPDPSVTFSVTSSKRTHITICVSYSRPTELPPAA